MAQRASGGDGLDVIHLGGGCCLAACADGLAGELARPDALPIAGVVEGRPHISRFHETCHSLA
jgi:hypothetical protein